MKDEEFSPLQQDSAPSQHDGTAESTQVNPPQKKAAKEDKAIPLTVSSKTRPVLLYIGIMFSVALLLLLLSFLMQQRNHEALMEGLTDLGDLQSIVDLKLENSTLQGDLAERNQDLATLQTEYESLLAEQQQAAGEATALKHLLEIRHAYDVDHYQKARELIADFEAANLTMYLSDTTEIEGGTSPALLYQTIKDALN